jgi:ligand-binding sensor domain-containing protein
MIQKIVSITFFIFFSLIVFAQDIAIGEWQAHLPFRNGVSVTQSETDVYLAFESQVAIINKAEMSIDRLHKVNGLSDINIQKVRFNREKNILVVAYENGNIDLVKAGGVININNIKESLTYNDKVINDISFHGNFAYLASNFGVVQLDIVRNEIKGTFPFSNPSKVNSAVVYEGKIYAFTNDGIFEGDTTLNLLDFSTWRKQDKNNKTWNGMYSQTATIFQNQLYASIEDTLKRFVNDAWETFPVQEWNGNGFDSLTQFYDVNYDIKSIIPNYNETSIVVTWRGADPARSTSITETGNYFVNYNPDYFASLSEAIIDQSNRWWKVDENFGGVLSSGGNYSFINPNAPFSSGVQGLAIADDKVWVAGGSIDAWTGTNDLSGTFSLEEGEWKRYSSSNYDELVGVPDHIRVAVSPKNGKTYLGTFGDGIVEIDGENITVFNDGTSLQTDILDLSKYKISGLAFDPAGNLWISNYGAARAISVFKIDGTWENFSVPTGLTRITEVVVDRNGYKWFATKSQGSGSGILVFDEGDLAVNGDERYTILTSNNSELPNNDVISLAVDLDGEIWVGTSAGTMIFECPGRVFDGECPGRRIVTESDNFGDYLLKAQTINTIMVDGANRKWFGTSAGIFVQSEDGDEDVLRLTTENSPLFSNNITALAFNDLTGEIFIGTDRGLLSYKSDATTGTNLHNENNILAYPNPVRPDYEGPIAIKGLVENANVKITDIHGTLMYETTANGGQAVWNGRNYNGKKASTGVYLVFSSRTDGTDAIVTKILFIN